MTTAKEAWEALPREKRERQIIGELTKMEVVLADPNSYNNYIALKTAFVGLMGEDRTDFLLTNRVSKLREKDRIRSTEEIEKQAERMADMTPLQMDLAFSWTMIMRFVAINAEPLKKIFQHNQI